MRVWKEPSAYSDRRSGNVMADDLMKEIAGLSGSAAVDEFEQSWMAGRYRLFPQTWLPMVQEECARRREEIAGEEGQRRLDEAYREAMARGG